MGTLYPGTVYANCNTQAKLNHALVTYIQGESPDYVSKAVFDATNAIVHGAIEDWPGAIGSVWAVIQDIYHIITNNNVQTAQALSQQLQTQSISLAARVSAIETFLSQQYGYVPPN